MSPFRTWSPGQKAKRASIKLREVVWGLKEFYFIHYIIIIISSIKRCYLKISTNLGNKYYISKICPFPFIKLLTYWISKNQAKVNNTINISTEKAFVSICESDLFCSTFHLYSQCNLGIRCNFLLKNSLLPISHKYNYLYFIGK